MQVPDLDYPYTIHPLATLMPVMTEAELAALAQDIAERGLLHPIVLCREADGYQVLDGRHRLQALRSEVCRAAAVEFRHVVWEPSDGQTPLDYVVSANLHRRHLTTSQRAALAVKVLPVLEAEAGERMRRGGVDPPENLPEGQVSRSGDARDQAGALLGVSGNYVSTAKRLQAEAPEVFELVLVGHLGLEPARQMLEVSPKDRSAVLDRLPEDGTQITRQVVRRLAAALRREKLSARAEESAPVLTVPADALPMAWQVLCGDARELVETLQGPVHCVLTSPPYFRKIRYGGKVAGAEIGHEPDPQAYVAVLCDLFDRIPLHPRGSVWINVGDTRDDRGGLLGVPGLLSQAMIQRGWLLVDEVVWAKSVALEDGSTIGNCMVEPCPHRLNGNGHEMLFRFVRTDRASDAWTDTCSVMMPRQGQDGVRYLPPELMRVATSVEGRNLHNVWRMDPGRTVEDHWATFPPELCERAIAMTCPPFVNSDGSLPERIVEWVEYDEQRCADRVVGKQALSGEVVRQRSGRNDVGTPYVSRSPITSGWTPVEATAVPGIVLDPFAGTGTVGEVALRLGRSFVGFELCEDYSEIALARCETTARWLLDEKLDPRALMK